MMAKPKKTDDDGAAPSGLSEAELLKSHEGLVRHMARRFGLADEDGYQAARIGVLVALRRFDPSRGTKFSTLAVWLIRKELQDEMRTRWCLSMPHQKRWWLERVRKARRADPSAPDSLIAAQAGMSERRLRVFDAISSMQATGFESRVRDDSRSLADILGDGLDVEGVLVDADERDVISTAIDALGERNATILRLRLSGLAQHEVASHIGISKARVGQLEVKAMDNLRRVLLGLLAPESASAKQWKPSLSGPHSPYSPDETKKAVAMKIRGASSRDIAAALGRSAKSVRKFFAREVSRRRASQ
jgi:RNA polymerase sigma factor (sigma-70 family)